jgi:hypothetical protein
MRVSMVEEDGRLTLNSPYHPDFPARARMIGGTWDGERHVWRFNTADRDRVETLCREIYGTGASRSLPRGSAATAGSSRRQRPSGRTSTAIGSVYASA